MSVLTWIDQITWIDKSPEMSRAIALQNATPLPRFSPITSTTSPLGPIALPDKWGVWEEVQAWRTGTLPNTRAPQLVQTCEQRGMHAAALCLSLFYTFFPTSLSPVNHASQTIPQALRVPFTFDQLPKPQPKQNREQKPREMRRMLSSQLEQERGLQVLVRDPYWVEYEKRHY